MKIGIWFRASGAFVQIWKIIHDGRDTFDKKKPYGPSGHNGLILLGMSRRRRCDVPTVFYFSFFFTNMVVEWIFSPNCWNALCCVRKQCTFICFFFIVVKPYHIIYLFVFCECNKISKILLSGGMVKKKFENRNIHMI